MTPAELRTKLLQNGRHPLGKLIEVPLKEEGKQLFADIKNSKAYSYFMVNTKTNAIREGHIYKKNNQKVFGVYNVPAIA